MKYLFLLTLFITNFTSFSQMDTVLLRVDILGQSYPQTNYYHPVEGKYLIHHNTSYDLSKKQSKAFNGLTFINPTAKLTQHKNHVQANSLRHYINPLELVYINWGIGSNTTNETKLDSFIETSKAIRKSDYQSIVQNYFNSFYIKQTEVTNFEYRQFVNWVRDSIQMEAVYTQYPSFEKAKKLLNIPENTQLKDTTNRREIRQLYNLDFECHLLNAKNFNQERIMLITEPFRLNFGDRWYKRKESDVTCYYYQYNEELLNVYPDTISWAKQHPALFNDPMVNMYFWHPAYDLHPVVGVSKQQAEAYCHWKTQQFKNMVNSLDLPFDISIELPNTKDYENAIKYTSNSMYDQEIEDYEIITNLKLEQTNSEKHIITKFRAKGMNYTDKTLKTNTPTKRPISKRRYKKLFKNEWSDFKSNHQHYELIEQRTFENYIENDICFLSNNVSEWMTENYNNNYKQLMEAYINFNCLASLTYCEGQRFVDETLLRANDKNGHLIYGGNWFDERYGNTFGINTSGLYPKTFKDDSKQFSTVGFRYVIRVIEK